MQGTGACVARAPYGVRCHPCPLENLEISPPRLLHCSRGSHPLRTRARHLCARSAASPAAQDPTIGRASTSGCVWGAPRMWRTRCRPVLREKGSPPFFDRLSTRPAALLTALAQHLYRMYNAYCTRTAASSTAAHRQIPCLILYAIVILFDSSAPASPSQPPPAIIRVCCIRAGMQPLYPRRVGRQPFPRWRVRVSVCRWLVCPAALY